MYRTDGWWEAAVRHRELKPLLCDDLEGSMGVVGGRLKKYMCIYGWFTLLYGRNLHNIVKQPSSN